MLKKEDTLSTSSRTCRGNKGPSLHSRRSLHRNGGLRICGYVVNGSRGGEALAQPWTKMILPELEIQLKSRIAFRGQTPVGASAHQNDQRSSKKEGIRHVIEGLVGTLVDASAAPGLPRKHTPPALCPGP